MASSKSLIRAGASMATRFLSRAFHTSPNPFLSPKHELIGAAKFLPSLLIPQSQKMAPFYSPPQPQNDVDSLRKLCSEGFLYPCGLPSLPFLLPEGNFFIFFLMIQVPIFLFPFCIFLLRKFKLINLASF